MTLPAWQERRQEDAHLFNPAFCGSLAFEFASSYLKAANDEALRLPLVFCALPLVLHKDTRESLPERTVTSLYTWLQRNPSALVGYSERATNLAPYLKEAISFCVSRDVLMFNEKGWLALGSNKANFTPSVLQQSTVEVRDIVTTTRLVGRWFFGAGETATIMAAWGISV